MSSSTHAVTRFIALLTALDSCPLLECGDPGPPPKTLHCRAQGGPHPGGPTTGGGDTGASPGEAPPTQAPGDPQNPHFRWACPKAEPPDPTGLPPAPAVSTHSFPGLQDASWGHVSHCRRPCKRVPPMPWDVTARPVRVRLGCAGFLCARPPPSPPTRPSPQLWCGGHWAVSTLLTYCHACVSAASRPDCTGHRFPDNEHRQDPTDVVITLQTL